MEVARDQPYARVFSVPPTSVGGVASPAVYWLLTDHLNSVRLVLDEVGNVLDQIAYDAFGNIVARLHPTTGIVGSFFDNPILFASREFVAETQLGR